MLLASNLYLSYNSNLDLIMSILILSFHSLSYFLIIQIPVILFNLVFSAV